MTSTLARPPDVTTPTSTRTLASRRDDAIGALCGLLLIAGGLTDAWAHVNILSTIDGFFTPWHALLYSGFAATAAWTWWLAFRHRRKDPRWFLTRWPIGYGIGAIGSLLFLVGGAGDMFWHEIFGVEASLEAALSPSHLVISLGGVLLLTSQMRSWWASGEGGLRTVTGMVSASLGTIMGVVIVVPMTGINTVAPTLVLEQAQGIAAYVSPAAQGIQAYFMGAVLLLIPFLLLLRRRSAPGAATAVTGGIGLFLMIEREFPMPVTAAIIGMIIGAAVVDVVLHRVDAVRGVAASWRMPIAGAVYSTGIWSGHMIRPWIAAGIQWPPELWAGTVVFSALLGFLLGVIAMGKPAQERA
jgi:hypothetical protein